MGPLSRSILETLSEMPEGYGQRRDGLRCTRGIIDANGYRFAFTMWWLVRAGLIRKWYMRHSLFESANSIPFYALTPAGRAALNNEPPER